MSVQAALGSDIALVFDECTPFHVSREYTERSMERTHRWLERCLRWHDRARAGRAGRVRDRPGRGRPATCGCVSAEAVAASGCDGIAIGGSLGQDKAQMHYGRGVDDGRARAPGARPAPAPARDRRHRRPDRRRRAGDRHVRLRDADAARAPRGRARARPGRRAGASIWSRAGGATRPSRSSTAAPAPPARPASRAAYLHYLLRAGELTALRLVTLHNLSFIARLMADLRAAIDAGRLAEVAAALRAGAAPGAVGAVASRGLGAAGGGRGSDGSSDPARPPVKREKSPRPRPSGPHKHGEHAYVVAAAPGGRFVGALSRARGGAGRLNATAPAGHAMRGIRLSHVRGT